MDTSYDDLIYLAMDELTQRAYREQRLTCSDFDERIRQHVKNSDAVEAVHQRLDPADRTTLESYALEDRDLTEQQMRYLYIQGAKDFVRLMKELGAL
ncbi:hypothetical protein LJC34_06925 [Oscillospiraceae bacterium OttesenSCG-928-G22]|nr:hypothetical protein [Oscillospiraceae bacterium OttesenSCG-928-G22]